MFEVLNKSERSVRLDIDDMFVKANRRGLSFPSKLTKIINSYKCLTYGFDKETKILSVKLFHQESKVVPQSYKAKGKYFKAVPVDNLLYTMGYDTEEREYTFRLKFDRTGDILYVYLNRERDRNGGEI